MSGLQCHKKLWFDSHDPIRADSFIFHIGNRFGAFARIHYGAGVNLDNVKNPLEAVEATMRALADPATAIIYEAAFLFQDTLIRADVLQRVANGWIMIEVKSSTRLKPEHIKDAAIQAYVIQACGLALGATKIAHINNSFDYKGDGLYAGLITEVDITAAVTDTLAEVPAWLATLLPLTAQEAPVPIVAMGTQCREPHACDYAQRCTMGHPVTEFPVTLLPRVGKALAATWAEQGITDLRDLAPAHLATPQWQMIQACHLNNVTWISQALQARLKSFAWPRFFLDFETIQQGVPLIAHSRPYQAIPFQWSVHRWDTPEQILTRDSGMGFLEYDAAGMDRRCLTTLLETLGQAGPVFAHNAPTEIAALRTLVARPGCDDLAPAVEDVIARIVDTLGMVRDGFYAPGLQGSYSLKQLVKVIPTTVDYANSTALSGGGDAQLAWFHCTDDATLQEEKALWTSRLKNYCAQDTLALYDLLKYLGESDCRSQAFYHPDDEHPLVDVMQASTA